jgi:formylglycine-generating enzyme required for sulfatase activity
LGLKFTCHFVAISVECYLKSVLCLLRLVICIFLIHMSTLLSSLRDLSKSLLFTGFAALCISSAESTSVAQSGGQDNWVWTGRKATVPTAEAATGRKCITINKNGMYVGLLKTPNTIEQYDLNGAFIKNWTATFTDLSGLASDTDGNVYAYDKGATKVSVFTSSGSLTASWGTAGSNDGQFSANSGYMVHAIAVDEQMNVYVADSGNSRIQVFSNKGVFLRQFGSRGDMPGQFRDGPRAVSVNPTFDVCAYDAAKSWYHVSRFSRRGEFIGRAEKLPSNYSWVEEYSFNTWSIWGLGGEYVFSSTPDGLLVVGAPAASSQNYWPATVGGPGAVTSGVSSVFFGTSLSFSGVIQFSNQVTTRGAAFDLNGNFWAVRDTAVECLERRMRFDVYKPTKAIPQGSILNVSQASGSKMVDIDYRVVDSDSASVETAIVGFVGGTRSWEKLVVPKTFAAMTPAAGTLAFTGTLTTGTLSTGSLASSIAPGVPYRVSWNAAADMPGQNFASLSFGVIARDGRPEIGVHYVTIPSDATNSGSLMVSSKPVQEDDLSDLWLWLLARRDPRVAVSGNSVAFTSAGQGYISGAPLPASGPSVANVAHDGSTTTVQGRAFAYKLINCRPITAAEKTRAQAGQFNLTSVDDNSVVSISASPIGAFALVTGGTLPASSSLGAVSVATFYMGKTEVTWGEWKAVRTWATANGYTDLAGVGNGTGDNYPVTNVSWYDVVKWCNARSEKEGKTPVYQLSGVTYKTGQSAPTIKTSANGYRLPADAEWEWAARGGSQAHGYTYTGSNDLNAVGWYAGNSGSSNHTVATKSANELGIYDMSGNVTEWTGDLGNVASQRVFRGGSCLHPPEECTVAGRYPFGDAVAGNNQFGFRVVCNTAP